MYSEGFNFLNGYSVRCHYTVEDDEMLKQNAEEFNLKIIALPEESGVVYQDGELVFFGECKIFGQ